MTQKQAIFNALLSGNTLTTLDAVREFGTVKLPTRIAEFEHLHDFYCDRKKVKFTTRYKTKGVYLQYRMKEKDKKQLRKLYVIK